MTYKKLLKKVRAAESKREMLEDTYLAGAGCFENPTIEQLDRAAEVAAKLLTDDERKLLDLGL